MTRLFTKLVVAYHWFFGDPDHKKAYEKFKAKRIEELNKKTQVTKIPGFHQARKDLTPFFKEVRHTLDADKINTY